MLVDFKVITDNTITRGLLLPNKPELIDETLRPSALNVSEVETKRCEIRGFFSFLLVPTFAQFRVCENYRQVVTR